jgi:hypothetical protein
MSEQNQQQDTIQEVKDIRRMMERSSRFISLSGLSGVSAGVFALIAVWIARYVIFKNYYNHYNKVGYWEEEEFIRLIIQVTGLAAAVFAAAFLSAFYFTWRKSKKQGVSLWNHTSKRLFWNMIIPLAAGGLFIAGMLRNHEWTYVAPASLVFYGLALVNASKYTLTDIRYLGYCEVIVGLVSMQWPGYGLYFWAIGFGILHIIYGIIMWWKYERL